MTMPIEPQQQLQEDEENFGIDAEQYAQEKFEKADNEDFGIDAEEYAKSPEAQEASWLDLAKDIAIQPTLGAAQAFTYPLDLLKTAMTFEAIEGVDEVEEIYFKQGKPFDRQKFMQEVAETAEAFPTQDMFEKQMKNLTGIETKPSTATGRFIRNIFKIFTLLRTSGTSATSAGLGGIAGAATTELTGSEIAGDIVGGTGASLERHVRQVPAATREVQRIAQQHGLPLPRFMTREEMPTSGYKISPAREQAFQRNLSTSTEDALDDVITNQFALKRLRDRGVDLEAFENHAWDVVTHRAAQSPGPINVNNMVRDIRNEVQRIRSSAPTLTSGQQQAIDILEEQAENLLREPWNASQLINQRRGNNVEVRNIYNKPEIRGNEAEIRNTYAFLNERIDNSLAQQVPEISQSLRAANAITRQNANLNRSERLIARSFRNGEYSAQKLTNALNSREGQLLRRDIGDQAITEMHDIARYGERAQRNVKTLLKNQRNVTAVEEWGKIAGLIFAFPAAGKTVVGAKVLQKGINYARGRMLMNPAIRQQYDYIIRNAANNNFQTMKADFAKLENIISDQYGSIEDFEDAFMQDMMWDEEDDS